jgi:hypothetical protein
MSRYKVPDLWWAVWPYTPPPVCGGRRPTVELRTVDQTRPRRQVDASDLLPCPFCGGPAAFDRRGTARQSCIVSCETCGCTLETAETFASGAAWNERALQRQPHADTHADDEPDPQPDRG